MPIYFISGGPGFGKTKLVDELFDRGYHTIPEAAREITETDKRFKGRDIENIDKKLFQDAVFERQKEILYSIASGGEQIVFCDRGFVDSVAYYRINGLIVPKELLIWASRFRTTAFILDPLDENEYDSLRTESPEQRMEIHREIIRAYNEFGYGIVSVPKMAIEKRANFVLRNLENL